LTYEVSVVATLEALADHLERHMNLDLLLSRADRPRRA